MNIEVSDREYWKELNYDDAELYCQLLVIGGKTDWRLPLQSEKMEMEIEMGGIIRNTWVYMSILRILPKSYMWVVPVRDI